MDTSASVSSAALRRLRDKIGRRILPLVFLLCLVAYLDRANVAFAKLPLTAACGFSEAAFGFGAGMFFLGYFLIEIPAALNVERYLLSNHYSYMFAMSCLSTCFLPAALLGLAVRVPQAAGLRC